MAKPGVCSLRPGLQWPRCRRRRKLGAGPSQDAISNILLRPLGPGSCGAYEGPSALGSRLQDPSALGVSRPSAASSSSDRPGPGQLPPPARRRALGEGAGAPWGRPGHTHTSTEGKLPFAKASICFPEKQVTAGDAGQAPALYLGLRSASHTLPHQPHASAPLPSPPRSGCRSNGRDCPARAARWEQAPDADLGHCSRAVSHESRFCRPRVRCACRPAACGAQWGPELERESR